ncbi:hypothetical protein JHK82_029739 [Glycine max]|uniref:Protein kinase domain-containing protein n=1 Tax=Glycine max TaxID=3847 RepID=I1LFY5_SOYBN|nr:uncharacterized protein LOC100819981 isoform X1 [Glycine max]KAG4987364.1 hypothetical protein JHK85_030347 [Glycine max]KAG4992993.1 hypothetical protein JHK86_029820 [Glycine max]KAG5123002.1 hypothetical protein JHK82_029739 [Glycine max]KAH1156975.1 hypothetical protein GYH30_029667 [Glycine max]KRH27707.1 hypothetical protein GLYMA_11G009700v4 [Glycine max]|eukprot:XP_003537756.1 uncharacterized protein LOC100819981 isoform X1 [Glycine max]
MVVVVPLDWLSFQHCLRNRTTHLPLSSRFTTTTTTSLCFHSPIIQAKLPFFTNSDSFQVGRPIGTYGFINVTSYSAFPSGPGTDYSLEDLGGLKTQDVGEGNVKIRLYEGRVSRGPLTGTPVTFKVYPGRRAGGVVADALAANELNTHLFLQSSSKGIGQNLVLLVGGFETTTGEQWLAFRDDGKYNAADYAKLASERVSRDREGSSWNPFEQGLTTKRRQNFIIKMLQGVMKGLAYLHDHDRLHQSLGPFSVVLNTISEREGSYLIPRLRDLAFSVNVRYTELDDSGQLVEGLWRRATGAGAFTQMEKRAFGIADDIYEAGLFFAYMAFVPFCEAGVMDSLSLQRLLENTFQLDLEATREYCLADDRLVNAVEFLDLGDGAGWELLQAMLNADFRKRPTAEAVLNHRFMTGAVL